mmetsp:Transcript_1253/g.1293  ORF Transcript_1253/g.1293 Transcript_1253/m.1293 type:complete len:127 (+) Transcript_1253:1039-1419(+)
MDELFGKLGIQKAVEGTAMIKTKETKARRALQTFGILAQYIDFESSFVTLLMPILKKAEISKSQSYIHKCEEALGMIASNILKNTSITTESLLIVLYAVMRKGTFEEEKLKDEDRLVEDVVYKKQK